MQIACTTMHELNACYSLQLAVVAPAAVVTHACMHAVDMHMCILGNLTGVVVAAGIKKMQ
jgi:hypothetical protein